MRIITPGATTQRHAWPDRLPESSGPGRLMLASDWPSAPSSRASTRWWPCCTCSSPSLAPGL